MERVGKRGDRRRAGNMWGGRGELRGRGAADLPPVLSICMLVTRKFYHIGVRVEKGREEQKFHLPCLPGGF